MKHRYFNTKEAANRHLEVKRAAAYKRITKKDWKVLRDDSHVQPLLFPMFTNGPYASYETDYLKWFV